MKRLEGKVAIVTGASRGIGRGIALTLAEEGATVVVTYREQAQRAEAVADAIRQGGGESLVIQADTSDISHIARLVRQTVEHFGALDEVTVEDFDHVFAVNTRGQFFAMQQAARHMSRGGRLICTSSMSASKGLARHALYAASKAAVEALARNLAVELGPRGITVNAIVPGPTATDMTAENLAHYSGSEVAWSLTGAAGEERIKSILPLGRMGTPADIARVVAFLVSEEGG